MNVSRADVCCVKPPGMMGADFFDGVEDDVASDWIQLIWGLGQVGMFLGETG